MHQLSAKLAEKLLSTDTSQSASRTALANVTPRNQLAPAAPTRMQQEIAMGFFTKILDKLGIHHQAAPSTAPPRPTSPPASPRPAPQGGGVAVQTAPPAPPPPKPVSVVDVVAQLEQRAAASPQKLNWRTSIVDLLKLLDIDSSFAARKELATELHCPPELMEDSAKMNVWLHKTVLARIAENGGNVPKDLLD